MSNNNKISDPLSPPPSTPSGSSSSASRSPASPIDATTRIPQGSNFILKRTVEPIHFPIKKAKVDTFTFGTGGIKSSLVGLPLTTDKPARVQTQKASLPLTPTPTLTTSQPQPPVQLQSSPQVQSITEQKWKPSDDILLKESIQTLFDCEKIATNVKFSAKFTAKEIEERWVALLYDEETANQATDAMTTLPCLNKRALWTEMEESILKREVSSNNAFSFQHILERFRADFHSSRTAKSLEAHYYRMKRLGFFEGPKDLLGTAPSSSTSSSTSSLSSTAANIITEEIKEGDRTGVHGFSDLERTLREQGTLVSGEKGILRQKKRAEYMKEERVQQRTILRLERDLDHQKEQLHLMDPKTLAIFREFKLRHHMRSRRIVIGRSPKQNIQLEEERTATDRKRTKREAGESTGRETRSRAATTTTAATAARSVRRKGQKEKEKEKEKEKGKEKRLDVNLAEEGKGVVAGEETGLKKVSRRHAIISLKKDGEFYIKNIGKRSILVNNRLILIGKKRKLTDHCLIQFSETLKFIFEINKTLLAQVKRELKKDYYINPSTNTSKE